MNTQTMIAKFKVVGVKIHNQDWMEVTMAAVTSKPFDKDGASEDNSFSRWTPSGMLQMGVTNPALVGKIQEGECYYLRFEKAE